MGASEVSRATRPHGHTATRLKGNLFPKPPFSRASLSSLTSPPCLAGAPKISFSVQPGTRLDQKTVFYPSCIPGCAKKRFFTPPAFTDRSENPFLTLPTSRHTRKRLFYLARIHGCPGKRSFAPPGFAGRSKKAFLTQISENSCRNTLVLNNLQSN